METRARQSTRAVLVRATAAAFVLLLGGCSALGSKVKECPAEDYAAPPTALYSPATRCEADSPDASQSYCDVARKLRQLDDTEYHMLVLEPESLPDLLPPPNLLLLSFEKPRPRRSERDWILRPYSFGGSSGDRLGVRFDRLDKRLDADDLRDELRHPRPQILTQVALIGGADTSGGPGEQSLCFAYSTYGLPRGDAAPACTGFDVRAATSGADAIGSSLHYLRRQQPALLARMLRDIDPTHVLLVATGWNTSQAESIFNYGEWYRAIRHAFDTKSPGTDFRPLMVGISWQSSWDDLPLGALGSALTKGNDADELGAGWVNPLVQQVVDAASAAGKPTILIGHSYGTRVLGHGVFLPDLSEAQASAVPDAFIAFAGAVPIRRFSDRGREPYWSRESDTPVLLISSKHDSATRVPFVRYVGGAYAIDDVQAGRFPRFIGAVGGPDGTVSRLPDRGEVVLSDSSATVSCNKPNSGGGAHSDVFDAAAGAAIWQTIQSVDARRRALGTGPAGWSGSSR